MKKPTLTNKINFDNKSKYIHDTMLNGQDFIDIVNLNGTYHNIEKIDGKKLIKGIINELINGKPIDEQMIELHGIDLGKASPEFYKTDYLDQFGNGKEPMFMKVRYPVGQEPKRSQIIIGYTEEKNNERVFKQYM